MRGNPRYAFLLLSRTLPDSTMQSLHTTYPVPLTFLRSFSPVRDSSTGQSIFPATPSGVDSIRWRNHASLNPANQALLHFDCHPFSMMSRDLSALPPSSTTSRSSRLKAPRCRLFSIPRTNAPSAELSYPQPPCHGMRVVEGYQLSPELQLRCRGDEFIRSDRILRICF